MHISKQDHPPDILGPILKPFTKLIIQIDKEVNQFNSSSGASIIKNS
jgi:hypothetical protein